MLNQIQQQEQSVIDVLRQATQALQQIGTTDLGEAVQQLERAAAEARARLQAAADYCRGVFSMLSADAGGISTSLAADLFGQPAETKQEPTTSEEKATTQVVTSPAAWEEDK